MQKKECGVFSYKPGGSDRMNNFKIHCMKFLRINKNIEKRKASLF